MLNKIENFLMADKNKEKVILLSLFFILFLMFYTHSIIVDSRLDLNLDPINTFKSYFYTWNQGLAFGQDYTVMNTYIFPFGFFYCLFFLLSNIYITQALIFSLGLLIGFYSFIKFTESEFGNKSTYNYIGGLFFIFNMYVLTSITTAYFNLTLPYLILPLQLYLLKQVCLSQNYLKYVFYFSIAVLFMGGINPPLMAINLIVVFVYFIHLIFKHSLFKDIKSLLKRLILCFAITLLINFYWIAGMLFSWLGASAERMGVVLSESLSKQNQTSSYLNVFRTLGLWAFGEGNEGKPYFSYALTYLKNPFLIFSMYLLPYMCLGSILLTKKKKQVLWILILAILSIPMVVASNQGIFASIYVWAYNNVPLFSMFRSSYKFIGIYIFTLSLLLVKLLYSVKNNKIKKILAGAFLLLIVINGFPFFTRKVIDESMKVKIPEYYYDAQNFFNNDNLLSRVLLLPNQYGAVYKWGSTKGNPELLWGKGLVVSQPITETEISNKITAELNKSILAGESEKANVLLGMLNVSYIVQRNDFDWKYYKTISQPPEVIKKALSSYNKIKTFGELDIYSANKDVLFPLFYAPVKSLSIDRIELLSNALLEQDHNVPLAVFIKNQNGLKKEQLLSFPDAFETNPTLEFKKINPVKYRVMVHEAKSSFPVVFSESFNDGWKVYSVNSKQMSDNSKDKSKLTDQVNSSYKLLEGNNEDQANKEELVDFISKGLITTLGDNKQKEIKHTKWQDGKEILDYKETYKIDFVSKNFQGTVQNDNLENSSIAETWFKTPLDEKNHLEVNGYANSWIIDPVKICGDNNKCIKNPDGSYNMELVVEFWPQRLFYFGLLISGGTLFGCIIYLLYHWQINKRRKNAK